MLSLRQCTATEAVRARDVGLCLQTIYATPLTGVPTHLAKQRLFSEGHVSSKVKKNNANCELSLVFRVLGVVKHCFLSNFSLTGQDLLLLCRNALNG